MSAHAFAIFTAAALLVPGTAFAANEDKKALAPAGGVWNVIPHLADGAQYNTTFILTNLANTSSSYKLVFHNNNGTALNLEIVGRTAASVIEGTLPANGSVQFSTPGVRADLITGWAELDTLSTQSIGMQAIFKQVVGGNAQRTFEAAVLASTNIDGNSLIPFDNTNDYVSSIAILNASTNTSTIPITLYDDAGAVILTESLVLTAGNKVAFTFPDRWNASRNKKGTIQFGAGSYAMSAVAFRFNPSGALATLAVMDK